MEVTASVNRTLLAADATNVRQELTASHRPVVSLATATALDPRTTNATSALVNVIVIRKPTDVNVINVKRAIGTSLLVSLATATVTLRLATRELVNAFSALIPLLERTATLALRATMAILCSEVRSAVELVAVPTQSLLVTLTPVNVRSSPIVTTTFTAIAKLDMLEQSAISAMTITMEAPR